ncbi:hypothetical protein U1Q18_025819 [Sarracenia purpurea var. burkii]
MSFKLLEITILSAQDLAPVSKLLRTYAVVWVDPDQKLTTRVDHRGHTNPTWNYRFVFRVDDKFLASAASAVTIEIYNVSRLRDIPVGTVHAVINTIIPPAAVSEKNSTMKFITLQIRRPSGSLHGILNLGINLIDGSRRSMPLDSALSGSTGGGSSSGRDLMREEIQRCCPKRNYKEREEEEEEDEEEEEGDEKNKKKKQKNANIRKLWRSSSERTTTVSIAEKSPSNMGSFTASILDRLKLGNRSKSKATTASSSSYVLRPLPSDVAASMAKGLYSASSDEIGSSILENWTVVGYGEEMGVAAKQKIVRWKSCEFGSTTNDHNLSKKRSDGKGLLSCFGIAFGYECNFICGAPKNKKKKKNKKNRMGENEIYFSPSAENLHLLYR